MSNWRKKLAEWIYPAYDKGYQSGLNHQIISIIEGTYDKPKMGETTIHKWENLQTKLNPLPNGNIEVTIKPKRKYTKKTTKKVTNGKKKNNIRRDR